MATQYTRHLILVTNAALAAAANNASNQTDTKDGGQRGDLTFTNGLSPSGQAPADARRALLRCALVELVGLTREDASAYVDGARLRDLPEAAAEIERCWRAALRGRGGASA